MAQKKQNKRKIIRRPVELNCIFCNTKIEPDYKEYKLLEKFVSDRAKILGRDRNGVCVKHQRKLPIQIKRARHLGLLPYSQTV
jgi:small subunit ribosomal protein S18